MICSQTQHVIALEQQIVKRIVVHRVMMLYKDIKIKIGEFQMDGIEENMFIRSGNIRFYKGFVIFFVQLFEKNEVFRTHLLLSVGIYDLN